MPVDESAEDLQDKQINATLVAGLKTRYNVSIDAAVRRVIDLTASVPVGALFLAAAKGGAREVRYGLQNKLFPGYVRSGSKVGWNGADNDPRVTTLFIDGRPRTYLVEALPLPVIPKNPNYPATVLLLQPSGSKRRTGVV